MTQRERLEAALRAVPWACQNCGVLLSRGWIPNEYECEKKRTLPRFHMPAPDYHALAAAVEGVVNEEKRNAELVADRLRISWREDTDALKTERDTLRAQFDLADDRGDSLQAHLEGACAERDALAVRVQALKQECEGWKLLTESAEYKLELQKTLVRRH